MHWTKTTLRSLYKTQKQTNHLRQRLRKKKPRFQILDRPRRSRTHHQRNDRNLSHRPRKKRNQWYQHKRIQRSKNLQIHSQQNERQRMEKPRSENVQTQVLWPGYEMLRKSRRKRNAYQSKSLFYSRLGFKDPCGSAIWTVLYWVENL